METRCQRRCFRTQRVEVTEWLTVTAQNNQPTTSHGSQRAECWHVHVHVGLRCSAGIDERTCWSFRYISSPIADDHPNTFPYPLLVGLPAQPRRYDSVAMSAVTVGHSSRRSRVGCPSLPQIVILNRLKWPLKSEHSTIQSIPLFKTFWEDPRTLFIVANFCSLSARTSDHALRQNRSEYVNTFCCIREMAAPSGGRPAGASR